MGRPSVPPFSCMVSGQPLGARTLLVPHGSGPGRNRTDFRPKRAERGRSPGRSPGLRSNLSLSNAAGTLREAAQPPPRADSEPRPRRRRRHAGRGTRDLTHQAARCRPPPANPRAPPRPSPRAASSQSPSCPLRLSPRGPPTSLGSRAPPLTPLPITNPPVPSITVGPANPRAPRLWSRPAFPGLRGPWVLPDPSVRVSRGLCLRSAGGEQSWGLRSGTEEERFGLGLVLGKRTGRGPAYTELSFILHPPSAVPAPRMLRGALPYTAPRPGARAPWPRSSLPPSHAQPRGRSHALSVIPCAPLPVPVRSPGQRGS